MFNLVHILPTGDELRNGTVLDTDTPMLLTHLLNVNGNCTVKRFAPTADHLEALTSQIRGCLMEHPDLIILIGGSGSGHLYSEILGRDITHVSMESLLTDFCSTELYGKNGHLWSKLICGKSNNTLIMNVPGPYVEAEAAMKAFCLAVSHGIKNLKELNRTMAQAVIGEYGQSFGRKEEQRAIKAF
jgi:molybdopterin biosynthesis enzyme MoaB